jgi:FAD/FMN-containing dehydrogenase/Fe-S oxidoreductase
MTVDLGVPRVRGEGSDLAAALAEACRGEVHADPGARAMFTVDASNYREVPAAVVHPVDADDVVAALAVCRRFGVPVLARGAGTALAGQSTTTGVVLDCTTHLNRIVSIDPESRTAVVEPGLVLDRLRDAAEAHGLTFGPDPATHAQCTLGGMIGNNSCGVHSVLTGRTADNVEALEVVTADGARFWVGPMTDAELDGALAGGDRRAEILGGLRALRDRYAAEVRARYPAIPRRVSGFNLDELLPERGFHVARALVGSEGTCAVVVAARLRLVPSPRCRRLVVIGYADGAAAADAVPAVLAHRPIGLEGFDSVLVGDVKAKNLHPRGVALLPDGGGWLLAEFGADSDEAALAAARALAAEAPGARILEPDDAVEVWHVRESGLGATARVPGRADTWPGWEDSAVEPSRLGDYLRELRSLLDEFGYHAALYGHYGDGCVHTRISFDLLTAGGVRDFRAFVQRAAELCVKYGGSLSGEHGDGVARAELLPVMYGEELVAAFREFKAVWDPAGMLNPGKVVDPAPLDANLRLGPAYRPAQPPTEFAYRRDGGFPHATTRCVGVGKCRRDGDGVMCPSWQATHDERHSTRGRARLLYEMLEGSVIRDGWRSAEVAEALDLCLACKGCKSDCPAGVDMATYKAEFFAHHYRGRLRPRSAYALGLVPYWLRLGSRVPALANRLLGGPVSGRLAKRAAGVAASRRPPELAAETFRAWWSRRGSPSGAGAGGAASQPVLLWPDTFTDTLQPDAGKAAVRVLEAAGFAVEVPGEWLCCGRPLHDPGFLGRARRLLASVLEALGPRIDAGVPLVGLEPSCVSVFRDELRDLFPDDPRAGRLADQSFTLAEFLAARAPSFTVPGQRSVLVQGHCHDRSVLGYDAEPALLRRCGFDVAEVPPSCCGMAGAFGFDAAKSSVADAVAGLALLPALREADPGTVVCADGFSCREMIRQHTDRRGYHLAEILASALDGKVLQ